MKSNFSKWVCGALLAVACIGTANAAGWLVVNDTKANGTWCGSSVIGLQTRDLNTVQFNSIASATLSSNAVSLPAGTYAAKWVVPGYQVGYHQSYLLDGTASVKYLGSSTYSDPGNPPESHSIGYAVFTIAGTDSFTLKQYTEKAMGTTGLGIQASTANGNATVCSQLMIQQM